VQEATIPHVLAARAVAVGTNATLVHSSPPRTPSTVFARVHASSPGSALQADWIRQVTREESPAAFDRMCRELAQLNALYARALQQASALMTARQEGRVSEGVIAALKAVEKSGVADTIAAMDSINDFEPLGGLAYVLPECASEILPRCLVYC
jgi:hypothetical protein